LTNETAAPSVELTEAGVAGSTRIFKRAGAAAEVACWSRAVACDCTVIIAEWRRRNMKGKIQITALALTGIVVFATGAGAQELKVGEVAPDFTLKASDGQTYTLSKLKGKVVVLAWFPKAFTGG